MEDKTESFYCKMTTAKRVIAGDGVAISTRKIGKIDLNLKVPFVKINSIFRNRKDYK